MSTSERRGAVCQVSVAPMMETTDRHYRFFMRQLTRRTLLYTEMITTHALLEGDRDRLLGYDPVEHPLALQLGGDDPVALAECARMAADYGYDEVNLNVGCPSDRVQRGSFGVCLMKSPEVVARAVEAMRAAVDLPITVKHRIGVDDLDRYEDMANFVKVVSQSGSDRFTVHARKAWLKGLSPKQNRNVPPLRYDDVYRLKREFPGEVIEINGGVGSLAEVREHLEHVDAVMIGRAAARNPYLFADVDREIFGDDAPAPSREAVVRAMIPYTAKWVARGARVQHVTRHLVPLYSGIPGARRWRQIMTEGSRGPDARPEVMERALAVMAPS